MTSKLSKNTFLNLSIISEGYKATVILTSDFNDMLDVKLTLFHEWKRTKGKIPPTTSYNGERVDNLLVTIIDDIIDFDESNDIILLNNDSLINKLSFAKAHEKIYLSDEIKFVFNKDNRFSEYSKFYDEHKDIFLKEFNYIESYLNKRLINMNISDKNPFEYLGFYLHEELNKTTIFFTKNKDDRPSEFYFSVNLGKKVKYNTNSIFFLNLHRKSQLETLLLEKDSIEIYKYESRINGIDFFVSNLDELNDFIHEEYTGIDYLYNRFNGDVLEILRVKEMISNLGKLELLEFKEFITEKMNKMLEGTL